MGNGPEAAAWFYRDPQGEQQGPFAAQEMAEWYRAGYFAESLLIWRQGDQRCSELGELVKMCGGGVPFLQPEPQPAMVQYQKVRYFSILGWERSDDFLVLRNEKLR